MSDEDFMRHVLSKPHDAITNAEFTRIFTLALRGVSSEAVEHDWISVDDRLPERGQRVLAFNRGSVDIGAVFPRDDGIVWQWWGQLGHESTFPRLKWSHWKPLPRGPRGDDIPPQS